MDGRLPNLTQDFSNLYKDMIYRTYNSIEMIYTTVPFRLAGLLLVIPHLLLRAESEPAVHANTFVGVAAIVSEQQKTST